MTVMPFLHCDGMMKMAAMAESYRGTKTLEYCNTICHGK